MLRALDAAAIGRWAKACAEQLDALRAEIDGINVYPVPDSDTGSNLLHTVRAALDALRDTEPGGAGEALAALARGAVTGARGNSGVILSQLLRGCAEELRETSTATGTGWCAALARAERLATDAVAQPAEGTILSVLRAGVRAAPDGADDLVAVAGGVATAAAEALRRTPEQLPVLAEAGVVDAGGRGLVAVFDALYAVVSGEPPPERPLRLVVPGEQRTPASPGPASTNGGYGYEVMYLLDDARDAELSTLRAALVGLGDCVTLAGDGAGRHAVHVHCDDIGAAIEAGIEAGRPHQIAVTPLDTRPARFARQRATLMLVRTERLAELVRSEGAYAFVAGGNEYDPARTFEAIRGTGAAHVVVLAADPELAAVAGGAAQRAEADGQDVAVVPCGSPVQGLAALAVHDAGRRATDDVVAMAEAAAATRHGELRIAETEALTWVGRCSPGDVLGLVDDEVVLVWPGPADPAALGTAACALIERMLASGGGELVTVLLGTDAPDALPGELQEYLHDEHPEVDLACYPGAGPEVALLLGVE